jgi:zinc protease
MFVPVRTDSAAYPALLIANDIFGGAGMSSRLMSRIREKDGLSYGVGSTFTADPFEAYGMFSFGASAAPENSTKVVDAFFDELERLRRDGVTDEEVAQARTAFLENEKASRTTNDGLADMLTTLLYTGKTFDDMRALEARVGELTARDVHEAVRTYWVPDHMAVVRAGSFK